MALPIDWKEFIESLNSSSVEYTLVGAFAVGYHAVPRSTGDLDILIFPSLENGARVLEALRAFGFGSLEIQPEDFIRPERMIQLGYPPNRIDLLTGISGVSAEEVWRDRVATEIDGVPVWIAGRATLIRNKRALGRPKDLADLDLLGQFGPIN